MALGVALPLAWTFSVMGAGLFWAFATELFGDRSHLEPVRFAPAVLLLAIGLATEVASGRLRDGFLLAHDLISAAFMVHLLVVIWSGSINL